MKREKRCHRINTSKGLREKSSITYRKETKRYHKSLAKVFPQ